MDVARIRLRSNGYDVFNSVVTANINGSLFHIKMVEEWSGPLQWIEHEKTGNDREDSSDSDDENGDGPPLSTAAGGWYNNSDEEWGDGESSEGEKELEYVEDSCMGKVEESVVQETVDTPNVSMHEPNDGMDGVIKPTATMSGEHNVIIEEEKDNIIGESKRVAAGECSQTHISNSVTGGGSQIEEDSEVGNVNGSCGGGGINEEVGCKKKGGPTSKVGKTKKRSGPEEKKKKERKARKEKGKAQVQDEGGCENNKSQNVTSSPIEEARVVRSSPNRFNHSISLSNNSNRSEHQVESVGDSGILMGNNRFERESERVQAEKLWEMAKRDLRVATEDDDDLYVEKIREMEKMDKAVKGGKGKKQCSK